MKPSIFAGDVKSVEFCSKCWVSFLSVKRRFTLVLDLGTAFKDVRRQVRDLTDKFQVNPLWRMVHIAIACRRGDVFTEDGIDFLRRMGYSDDE